MLFSFPSLWMIGLLFFGGRNNVVGIANRCGVEGPGIESRWARFSVPVQTGRGVHPASYTMGTGSLSRW
jgi:hypothetical protein